MIVPLCMSYDFVFDFLSVALRLFLCIDIHTHTHTHIYIYTDAGITEHSFKFKHDLHTQHLIPWIHLTVAFSLRFLPFLINPSHVCGPLCRHLPLISSHILLSRLETPVI